MPTAADLPDFLTADPPPVPPPSESRLRALYASSSSQRLSNPTGYNANVSWWIDVIIATVRSGYLSGEDGDRLILSMSDGVLGKFDWGGRKPKGLGGVIETQATSTPAKFHPLPHFLSSPIPLHTPPSLTSKYVGRPLWWALSQLNPFSSSNTAEVSEEALWKRWGKGKEYVVMDLLEPAAALFLKHLSDNPPLSYSASLHDLAQFRDTFGTLCFPNGKKNLPSGDHKLGKRDCEVLIKWLSRDCGVLVSDGSVVKLLEEGQDPAEHEITEADRGTIAILRTVEKVELQIGDIEKQIAACQAKAKKQLSANQKNLALTYLRSKKSLEELLEKRVAVLEQLQTVIRKIDQAQGDIEIMSAYEKSTATLGEILKNPKLDAENIANTTDALVDTLADAKEIEDAVADGGRIAVGAKVEVDEDELAEELEGLVKEEKERQAAEARKLEEDRRAKESTQAQAEAPTKAETPKTDGTESQKETKELAKEETEKNKEAADGERENGKEEEAQEEWSRRFEDAQQREMEEKARAAQERLAKEARMEAA